MRVYPHAPFIPVRVEAGLTALGASSCGQGRMAYSRASSYAVATNAKPKQCRAPDHQSLPSEVNLRSTRESRGVTDENVIQSLLEYIRSTTARRGLAYAETPTRMSGGFDATILGFSLRGAPEPFSGPLVLRLFQANADGRRAPREAAMQKRACGIGLSSATCFCRRGADGAIRGRLLDNGTYARTSP